MTAAYSNESDALESPGPGGSLKWTQHMSGHWTAQGLGGKYDIYPRGASGYTAYWSQAGTGTTHELGNYDTLGAAFGAARRHADGERRQTAAEEEDHDAVAKDVARKAVASAYGADQVDHLSKSRPTTPGDPSFWNAWLKNGKRLTVHVDGSTGTVRDPDDNHVVTTHTVSEDHSDYARAVRAGRHLALHHMKTTGDQIGRTEAVSHFERQGFSREHAKVAADAYQETWRRIESAAEECGDCAHKHPKSVPTTPCRELSKVAKEGREKPIVIEKTGEHSWIVFVHHNPIVNVAKRGTKPELSWKGRKNYVEGSKRHIFKTRGDAENISHQVGRYVLNFGDFVFSYVEYKNDVPTASETVPVIHEANDAGPFATVDRDTKELEKGHKLGEVHTPQDVYKLVHEVLSKESQEVFLVLPMDVHSQLMSRPVEIARGQRDRVSIGISDVMRPVIATNASRFVVVHNHPSGKARPSPKDRELTDTIRKHTLPDVVFCDHIVVGLGCFYSFTENKLFKVR
jgi:DNA repair protein RadC